MAGYKWLPGSGRLHAGLGTQFPLNAILLAGGGHLNDSPLKAGLVD